MQFMKLICLQIVFYHTSSMLLEGNLWRIGLGSPPNLAGVGAAAQLEVINMACGSML